MIPKFSTTTVSSAEFLVDYALANEACMLDESFTADWPAVRQWNTADGRPNLRYLVEQYGDANVPVLLEDECVTMKFSDFVERHIRPNRRPTTAYLKDWHFQNAFPDCRVYRPPAFLAADWINNETWTSDRNNVFGGDYRFVYFGAAESWTPFHCDVMCSYSWSANICGRKLWYLLRPGAERHFAKAGSGGNFVADLRESRDRWPAAGVIEFEQKAGEIVFVPSGWYHQVHNLEDTISINHNVINAFNVPYLLELVKSRRDDVEREIDDVRSSLSVAEFDVECEKILLADCRMNRAALGQLLDDVSKSRSTDGSPFILPSQPTTVDNCKTRHDSFEELMSEFARLVSTEPPERQRLTALRAVIEEHCTCRQDFENFCDFCRRFWRTFEFERAAAVRLALAEISEKVLNK